MGAVQKSRTTTGPASTGSRTHRAWPTFVTGELNGVNPFVDTGQDGSRVRAYRVRPLALDGRMLNFSKATADGGP
jgi:hypothetical protein